VTHTPEYRVDPLNPIKYKGVTSAMLLVASQEELKFVDAFICIKVEFRMKEKCVRFELPMAVTVKIAVLRNVMFGLFF
jgi:hypothetical protein